MLKALCRLACLLLLLPAAEPTIAAGDSRPNVVLILADDLETGTLPLFPNITRHLVQQGASFDRFFVTNSWCCPSRASILRSQHVHSHGVLTNTAPEGDSTASTPRVWNVPPSAPGCGRPATAPA
ncbi:sulfatase-like hydrolase/transferase [Nonomuraea rubra]|uniref:sulfatase-like hydrolase/transferase n=1 Tax=Nonomuraea rubra TaxID=46180 RepID=UPI003617EDD9